MKKIILIVVAALATYMSSAASINWKTSSSGGKVYGDATTVLASATAYLIDASVLSQADLAAAISGGKTFAEVTSGKTLDSASVSDGKINKTFETSAYAAEATPNFYVAVLNGDNYYASDSVTATISGVGDTTVQYKLSAGTKAADAWKDATGTGGGVPEPTSGLLLLVGGALLALRRRRA